MDLSKWKIEETNCGYGPDGLVLLDGGTNRILSLLKCKSGAIDFREECDGYFSVRMSKKDAKLALQEAIAWIDSK